MRNEKTKVIDAQAIAAIVGRVGIGRLYDLVIERLADVMVDMAESRVEMRERDGFVLTEPYSGLVEWMPASRRGSLVTVKVVGYHPHNPVTHGQPTILSTLHAFDAASGHLTSIVDGTFATAIRTGAATALASGALASSARVLGLVGCGAQAVTQLHALDRVFDIEQVLVCDVDEGAAAGFARRARDEKGRVRVASASEIAELADVVCTATSVEPGSEGVIGSPVAASHINAIGSDMPGKTELPLDLLRDRVVCPDHRGQAEREGECQRLSADEIGPSISDVLADGELAARLRGVPTVYDSTGLAVQDLVMAELFEELAEMFGVGTYLAIEANMGDPRDPYAFLEGSA